MGSVSTEAKTSLVTMTGIGLAAKAAKAAGNEKVQSVADKILEQPLFAGSGIGLAAKMIKLSGNEKVQNSADKVLEFEAAKNEKIFGLISELGDIPGAEYSAVGATIKLAKTESAQKMADKILSVPGIEYGIIGATAKLVKLLN